MPKRIPNLPETILDQAAALFSRHGYAAVDMKQVAAEAGTSVGNLYNYYPSKPALFFAVVKRWREDLLDALKELMATGLPRREKILAIMHRVYDDLTSWHGLWSEFLRGSREERSEFMDAKAKAGGGGPHPFGIGENEMALLAELETLIRGTTCQDGVARWALIVITATIQLAARYPEGREENWKFLEELVDKL